MTPDEIYKLGFKMLNELYPQVSCISKASDRLSSTVKIFFDSFASMTKLVFLLDNLVSDLGHHLDFMNFLSWNENPKKGLLHSSCPDPSLRRASVCLFAGS